MMKRRSLAIVLLFCALEILSPQLVSAASDDSYKVVCYLGSWANYRHGKGKFLFEDIDPSLCTHLIYGFAKLGSDNRIAVFDPYLDLKENWGLGAYDRFNDLKKRNPRIKTLIAIGGWNEGSVKYSQMARTRATREIFINSCVDFVSRYGFDGLDMDWEYPANRGGLPEDKQNFVSLLKEMKEAFRPRGLLLTAAVSAGSQTVNSAYDVPSIAKYLDFINVMAYDFHGAWESVTGHNAPLYKRPGEKGGENLLNVDSAVKIWLSGGAPREKIILGMPLYGRSFTLQDPTKTSIGSPVNSGGTAGPYTQETGMMGFNEICNKLQKENGWTIVIDKYYRAPYAFKDRLWIGYDDIESIAAKVDYVKEMNLGGAMVWSLETDDFHGECEGFSYPLLRTIRMGLGGKYEPQTTSKYEQQTTSKPLVPLVTTRRTSPVTSISATTSSSTSDHTDSTSLCTKIGYFRHPKNCKQFYFCASNMSGGFDIYWYTCAPGTVFSEAHQSCNFPLFVPECTQQEYQ